jgi:lipid II:glycine glycyltransferase (peptidoglycan interpeptide bridge formation enzyme)
MPDTNTHPLQSKAWEIFRKKWGNEVVRVNGNLLTLHKVPLLNKKIAIFEKGPTPTSEMLENLKDFGKKNNLIFIKLEPNGEKDEKIIELLRSKGAYKGKTIFTPTSFWIDLTKSEDELMKSFGSKTRYNIRYAQKKGVTVEEDNSDTAFEKYLELMRETTQRDKFYAHSEKYHRLMWEILHPAKIAHLLVAKYNNEIITAWVLFTYDKFLYYPYGASTQKYKNIMANNLMMWEAIRFGKKMNLTTFDLWGREPGKGFTKFKEGYNPEVVKFLGTWDLIINKPMYYLYRIMDFLRWQVLRLKSKFTNPSF